MAWSRLKKHSAFYLIAVFAACLLFVSVGSAAYAAESDASAGAEQEQTQKPDIQNSACTGANLFFTTDPNSSECSFNGLDVTDKLNKMISEVINFFSVIIGVIAVLMIVVGGFRYIISGGDSGNVTSAKNTILYAIIGLIIVVFAQFIVKFILSKAVNIASG